jgi:hypothetical protein
LSRALQHKSLAEVDEALRRQHLDASERLAVKLQLQASAAPQGRTVRAGGRLVTDAPGQAARSATEMDRTLRRLGLAEGEPVTMAELEARMTAQDMDAASRISVKIEAAQRGLLATAPRYATEAELLLEHLGISGPVRLDVIEEQMDRAGWGVTAKNVVKAELQARNWLRTGSRSMRAAADRGVPLVNAQGQAVTLRSIPE